MQNVLYQYNAVVTSVYDGDSCTVDIDLGLHTWIHGEKIRLIRIKKLKTVGILVKSGYSMKKMN